MHGAEDQCHLELTLNLLDVKGQVQRQSWCVTVGLPKSAVYRCDGALITWCCINISVFP